MCPCMVPPCFHHLCFTSITTSAYGWVQVYNALAVVVSYGHFSGPLSGVDISINAEDVKIPNQASWPRFQCHKQDITTVLYPASPPPPNQPEVGVVPPSLAELSHDHYCLIRFGVLHKSSINPDHINVSIERLRKGKYMRKDYKLHTYPPPPNSRHL